MPRKIVQVKVCDRPHPRDVDALQTERFVLNGHRYEMELCAECSAELAAAVSVFADYARKTGEPTLLDRPRVHRTVEVPVARPTPAPVRAEQRRLQVLSREPLPATAERWQVSEHARERMASRQIDLYEVLMTCERPELSGAPSRAEWREVSPDVRELHRGDVKLFVNVRTREVLTVVRKGEFDLPTSADYPTHQQKVSS